MRPENQSPAESGAPGPAPAHSVWTWRSKGQRDTVGADLLYEPGNWGDLLKSTWALRVARWVRQRSAAAPVAYVDPFAGASTYPLSPAARRRIESSPQDDAYRSAQAAWIARDRIASSGRLVLDELTRDGALATASVWDVDPARRESWRGVPGVKELEIDDGDEAIEAPGADLVLVDPYDAFDRWPALLPRVVAASRRATVLLYMFNRSPRGGGHRRTYEALRRRLADLAPDPWTLGRVPSDPRLASAAHEILLLGPGARSHSLTSALEADTLRLGRRVSDLGAWERGG